MRIFGLGVPELVIILIIVCVLFGPVLFKKLGKQVKATGKAAKKGIESGAAAAGKSVDLDNVDKGSVLDKVEGFQDRIDKMFQEEEGADAADSAAEQPAKAAEAKDAQD